MPLQRVADADTLAAATADAAVRILAAAVHARGHASLALSGGTTPRLFLPLLAAEPRRRAVAWESVSVFWADERCVPPDHPESNFGMAHDLLLSRVPVPPEQIHRIYGELPPEAAADRYIREMEEHFGSLPRFDLVLLGMGSDGHTASLFPGSASLDAQEYACAVHAAHLDSRRITLTLPVLNNARAVVFSVSGKEKAAVLREMMDEKLRKNYPAGRVLPKSGELLWLADNDACSLFSIV